jgi:cysteine desulfurase
MSEAPHFIYLDYNATTPVDPRVSAAMVPILTGVYGNPSSGHAAGRAARDAVERAREQIAACLGAEAGEILFTSGGSEANNWALTGTTTDGGHVITSSVEHPAILEPARALERAGRIRLTVLPVDRHGAVDPNDVARALAADTRLVTVMLANNEVGTLEPLREIATLCRERGVLLHTDAAQAVGKIPVDVRALGVDLLTVAGHKLYAPKGIGVLFLRRGVELAPLIRGAAHERGLRAGTENVAGAVGLGTACALAAGGLAEEAPRLRALRDRLEALLSEGFPGLVHHGHPERRLPNTASLAFPGVDANLLLTRLADEVGASAGAACHTGDVTPSHVLAAMGVSTAASMSTVRLSVGRFTTEREVEEGASRVLAVVCELTGSRRTTVDLGDAPEFRLTRYTHGLGCACKLQPRVLEEVLHGLPPLHRAEVLVGADTRDDACAWRLEDGTVLVQTVDFFTPVVDSPRLFGAIAAANALSDIYAMGARPLFALNVAGFPVATLPTGVLEEILAGAQGVADEVGIPVLGGHTIEDTEPKFGWVVTGVTTEDELWRNGGARPGDLLVLTKPLGTGIWATAAKHARAPAEGWERACRLMRRLNATAAEALRQVAPHAVTDVTGFGLLGHLHEMLVASGAGAELWCVSVPVLEGTRRLAEQGEIPGGTRANLEHARGFIDVSEAVDELDVALLADAQTSGGLLAAVVPTEIGALEAALARSDDTFAVVGRVIAAPAGSIRILRAGS